MMPCPAEPVRKSVKTNRQAEINKPQRCEWIEQNTDHQASIVDALSGSGAAQGNH
jgi:hypothetical protein